VFPRKSRRISTDLHVIPFSSATASADLNWLACGGCQLGLRVYQPDPNSPTRLLGTCDGCGRWYMILMEPDGVSALIVSLPESELFRSAWEDHGGPDGDGTVSPSGGSEGISSDRSLSAPGEESMENGMVKVHAPDGASPSVREWGL
jgi:hypothetical protein